MRRIAAALLALLPAAARAATEAPAPLMQEAVAAYREGRLEEALLKLGEIVEREPENAVAKNYVWAVARRVQKERSESRLPPEAVERAVALAEAELEARRLRTREALERMKEVARRSGNVRSPADVLSGVEGLERFIGKDLEEELADVQTQDFLGQIAGHLSTALERKIFVSLKDQSRVEGYLAYVQRDWDRAAELWRRALKEDPSDESVRRDIEALEALVRRKAAAEKVEELSNQGQLYFRSGRYAEAVQAWEDALRLDKDVPGLAARAAAARAALEKQRLQSKLKAMTEEGLALYKGGDAFGAAEKWLEVLQLDPTFEEARGWLQHAGRRLRAAPAAPAAPKPSPEKPRAAGADPEKALKHYKEGMILYAQGNLPEAVRAWEECLRLDPSFSRAREALRQASAEMSFK